MLHEPRAFDLQAAIDAAAPGSTLLVPAGHYPGPVHIRQPLTLLANGPVILDGGGRQEVLRITAPDVTVRGCTIRGSGDSVDGENAGVVGLAPRVRLEDNRLEDVLFGIYLKNAEHALIRGNTIFSKDLDIARRGDAIRLWNSHHSRIEDNTIRGSRDVVIWFSADIHLARNRVTDGRYGLHFMYSHDSVLEDNELTDNSVGTYLMYSRNIVIRRNVLAGNRGPSGYGLGLKDVDGLVAEENSIAGNRIGVYIDNSPYSPEAFSDFRRNVLAGNDVGVAFQPAVQRNRFSANTFLENLEQVAVLSGGTFGGNDFAPGGQGNFWSDYAGYDLDGDGQGDLPYQNLSLFENLMDREPMLRFFLYSPAQQALELAARALPIVRPQPRFSDPAPRMRPIQPPLAAAPPRLGALAALGGGLILGAAGTLALARRPRSPRPIKRNSERETPARASGDGPTGAGKWPDQGEMPMPEALLPAGGNSSAAEPILRVQHLTKTFGRQRAVDDLDLAVRPGEAVALWGRNGAGKTTALKCVLGLYRYRGRISVAGCDVRRQSKAARRRVGYVSQELAFYAELTARDTLHLFARLRQVPSARAAALLERVELGPHATKPVKALSGGMKQRLALAVALLSDPPLLLLDEPTANLDATSRELLLHLLAELRRAGQTIVFSTHRLEEVRHLADRVLVLEQGRKVADCTPAELAGRLAPRRALRIPLGAELRPAALNALAAAGLSAAGNGRCIRVPVTGGQQAVPLRVLAAAGIPFDDFELEGEGEHVQG